MIRFEVWQEIMPAASPGAYPTVPRVLPTSFIDEWRERLDEARRQSERLRGEIMDAVREGRVHEMAPFAGQTAGMVHDILPAAEIVRRLVAEVETALAAGSALMA